MSILSGIGSIVGNIGGIAGSFADRKQQQKQFEQNYKNQKEFAQNSIQWRVEDAKKAGLHPLAALGMASGSYTPTSYNSNYAQSGAMLGDAISGLGQALDKNSRRMSDLQVQLLESQVESQKLQNQGLKKTIAGQQSNQMNSVNDGLSKRIATSIVDDVLDRNRLREAFKPTNSARYSGGDYSQAWDDYAAEHRISNKLSEYFNMPKGERDKIKVDLLRSMGQPGLVVVPQDDLTTFDYMFYNAREKAFRYLDKVFGRLFYSGENQK